MKQFDAVVIGAGPGGMTAALYLCRFGLKTAMVEKLAPGGQLLNTFEVANYLGFPDGTPGWNLADNFNAHLEKYELERYNQGVKSISFTGKRHQIHLDYESIEAKTVIVCTGATPRRLGLPEEERLIGRGVSYCAMCDGMFFRNKVVAMVGGGNSALEEALHLSHLVKKLYLVHRRDRFRADKVHQDKIEAQGDKIELVLNSTVSALHGEEKLTGVTVVPVDGSEPRLLEVEGLFVFIGIQPANQFLFSELELDESGFVVTDCEMRTDVPGLFAAGDIRAKQCRQVVTAVGDGATAAYSAFAYLETLEE